MKEYSWLLLVALFASCSGPLNKPVVEPLAVDELRLVMKKDTSFIQFYENLQEFRQPFFSKDINQVKFGDITYKQLLSFIEYVKDTAFINPIMRQAENEWDKNYNKYDQKLDSLLTYWTNYLTENSPESYIDIEFDHIYKTYYSYSKDIKDVNLAFKLTPLKGTIQQISFTYKITSKIQADSKESIYRSIYSDSRGSCLTTTPISKPVIRYWEVNYSLKKTLKNISSAELVRDYDIIFKISKIRINNTNISEDDLLIPDLVNDYIRYPSLYEDEVIKYYFNSEYIPKWKYIDEAVNEELKKKDEKCYDFLKAVFEFEEGEKG